MAKTITKNGVTVKHVRSNEINDIFQVIGITEDDYRTFPRTMEMTCQDLLDEVTEFVQYNNQSNWTEEMLNSPFVTEYNKAILAGEFGTALTLKIICTKRDLSMWAKHKMKPTRHWKVSDVKWYFGITGNAKKLLQQYLIIFNTVVKPEGK